MENVTLKIINIIVDWDMLYTNLHNNIKICDYTSKNFYFTKIS